MDWIYIVLFKDPRGFILNPLIIHTTITLVVLNYMYSHSCPGLDP